MCERLTCSYRVFRNKSGINWRCISPRPINNRTRRCRRNKLFPAGSGPMAPPLRRLERSPKGSSLLPLDTAAERRTLWKTSNHAVTNPGVPGRTPSSTSGRNTAQGTYWSMPGGLTVSDRDFFEIAGPLGSDPVVGLFFVCPRLVAGFKTSRFVDDIHATSLSPDSNSFRCVRSAGQKKLFCSF